MSVTLVSQLCSVTMVALVACTPFGTGGYPACYQCGVASTQCGGIGSPGAVVPLCQVTLLASSPSLHHAYHGSLVTPSICFRPPSPVSPIPVCVMCDVTSCDPSYLLSLHPFTSFLPFLLPFYYPFYPFYPSYPFLHPFITPLYTFTLFFCPSLPPFLHPFYTF